MAKPTADELATLARKALAARNNEGYAAGKYIWNLKDDFGTLREENQKALQEANAAVRAFWSAFYDFVDKDGE